MKTDSKYPVLSVACTVFVIFLIIVTAAASMTEMRVYPNNTSDHSDFSSGWFYDNGEEADLGRITGSCRLHKVIPHMESHMTLSINARNLNIDIYIDDECVYKYTGTDNTFLRTLYGKTAGSDFIDVKITKESEGKTLYIDAKSPYRNSRACKIVNVYFGNSTPIETLYTSEKNRKIG